MSMKVIGNMSTIGYKGRIIDHLYMTDSEAAVEGRAYKLSTRRWTKAATTDRIYAICVKAASAGTDVLGVMEIVKAGDIIRSTYTGTADAAFVPGLEAGVLDANGDNVDAATVSGGHIIVLAKDTVNSTVDFITTKNFTQAD